MVLVDEINRASPKTQSALLECMQEVQVTIDGMTHPLARPFMVIATQNPIEYEGTFPLPEAQLDRFTMRLHLGYPSLADEARMLSEHAADEPLEHLEPVASAGRARGGDRGGQGRLRRGEPQPLRRRGAAPHARRRPAGAGRQPARRASRCCAWRRRTRSLRGREYVIPADVKEVAADVLSHRVILAADARSGGVDAADADPRGRRADPGARLGAGAAAGKAALALGAGLYIVAWGFGTSELFAVAVGLIAAAGCGAGCGCASWRGR